MIYGNLCSWHPGSAIKSQTEEALPNRVQKSGLSPPLHRQQRCRDELSEHKRLVPHCGGHSADTITPAVKGSANRVEGGELRTMRVTVTQALDIQR